MLKKNVVKEVNDVLSHQAVVGIVGPRQVAKTMLTLEIGKEKASLILNH